MNTTAEQRGRRICDWYDALRRDFDMLVLMLDEDSRDDVRAVALRHLDQLSNTEIASRLDCSGSGVYSRLRRGYAYIGDTMPVGAWDSP